MRYCGTCDFAFAWPVPPFNAAELYSRAYMGKELQAGMEQYHSRLARRTEMLRHERLALPSPVQPMALEWLEANVPRGATILDIGCGIGGFMRALKTRRYHSVGIDVAEPVARALRDDGFEVWCGSITDAPKTWPQPTPAAITCFRILHHLPDPVAFLGSVRKRWCAPILIGQNVSPINQLRKDPKPQWFPNRTLGWWTEYSIEQALKAAGYSILEMSRRPKLVPIPVPLEAQRLIGDRLWRWPRARVAFLAARGIYSSLASRAARRLRFARPTEELLVIASPT